MTFIINIPQMPQRPIWTYLKPCTPCPAANGSDPEADMIASNPGCEGHEDFRCAWRQKGFCTGWAKKLNREYNPTRDEELR